MARPRVFVVQPVPQVAVDVLSDVADVEVYPHTDRQVTVGELAAAASRSDYIFTMHETIIPRVVLEANPALRGIGVGGDDYGDFIDVTAVEELGIPLLKLSEEQRQVARLGNAKTTADLTVALLLCCAYRVIEADAYTRAGGFRQEMTLDLMGVGCPGKTVGLIGLGWVAREMVPKLRALEMDVVYTKRTRLSDDEERSLGVRWVADLDDVLAMSDYVCMMANYHPGALKLMGAKQFALMKPTAYFINTARGRLVDEDALIAALADGTIAGAGLDVYWYEPPVQHDPFVPHELRRMPNVVLAPHNGGATWDSRGCQTQALADVIAADIRTRG